MPRKAKNLICTSDEIAELQKAVNAHSTEQRIVRRAKIILLCQEGKQIKPKLFIFVAPWTSNPARILG